MKISLSIEMEYEILFEATDTEEDKIKRIEDRVKEENDIMNTSKQIFMKSKRFKPLKFNYKIDRKK